MFVEIFVKCELLLFFKFGEVCENEVEGMDQLLLEKTMTQCQKKEGRDQLLLQKTMTQCQKKNPTS